MKTRFAKRSAFYRRRYAASQRLFEGGAGVAIARKMIFRADCLRHREEVKTTRHRIPTIFNLSMVDVLRCALGCASSFIDQPSGKRSSGPSPPRKNRRAIGPNAHDPDENVGGIGQDSCASPRTDGKDLPTPKCRPGRQVIRGPQQDDSLATGTEHFATAETTGEEKQRTSGPGARNGRLLPPNA